MDIEKLPTLKPENYGSLVDPARPILSLHYVAAGPHRIESHRHPRAQILFPLTGVYRVVTPLGNYVVPPVQAIWIPSHIEHTVFSNAPIRSLLLFIDECFTGGLPGQCMVIDVSPLLRELIIEVVDNGNDYPVGGKEHRLVEVILDQLREMKPTLFHLPLATDRRLRRIMEWLLANPADARDLEQLARASGASSRTLARLFNRETGMTFAEWRRHLRLLEAIELLGQGHSVSGVAWSLGYKSASAFIAMFRRTLGVSPGYYCSAASTPRSPGVEGGSNSGVSGASGS